VFADQIPEAGILVRRDELGVGQEVLGRSRLAELVTRFDLYPEVTRKGPIEGAIERMRKDIQLELKSVEQGSARGGTIAFVLGYRGRDPQVVAAVTNALASFYVEQNSQLRERQAIGTTQVVHAQLEDVKKRLAAQESRIRDFRARHTGELPEQVPVNLATLERLLTELHARCCAADGLVSLRYRTDVYLSRAV